MTDADCPICDTRFASDLSVRDHVWDAHGACHRCGDRIDDEEALYVHWLTVHDDELSSAERARAESAVDDPTFADRLEHQGLAGALTDTSVGRRGLLAGGAVGLGAVVGGGFVTGAFGGDGDDPEGLADHPAAAGIEDEPTLGPPPGDADGTIIAFEDPSCPSCGRFERQTFPELKSGLVDTGAASFVFRGIPVIREWSQQAVPALEATYARDEEAFWALKAYYYREQDQFGSENVMDATRQFLADETSVDAAAVAEDVESGAYEGAVDADLQASEDAGVRGTPTFFLFRDGEYVTKLAGPQSYDVFENSLGV